MIKTLNPQALSIIDQYLHFKVGSGECSVPYFNNKTVKARAALRSVSGKGNPQEITEEVQAILIKDHVDLAVVTGEALKKVLTDNNIGIDCSAFAYYILDAEANAQGKGSIKKGVHFAGATGLIGKIRCSLRPIENFDVLTFANNRNSSVISLKDVRPGDVITMINGPEGDERNHILVVHQVDASDSALAKISYSHAVAYPEDGVYGTGIKQGVIEIIKPEGSLADQIWSENIIFIRAQKSQTELRRLNKLC
jgi:hypothetical protein